MTETTTGSPVSPEDAPLGLEAAGRILAEQEAQAGRALGYDPRLGYLAWGVAWFVAYGSFWLNTRHSLDRSPSALQWLWFALPLVAAGVVSGIYSARRTQGIKGMSEKIGGMIGWTWGLAFIVGMFSVAAIIGGLYPGSAERPPDVWILYVMMATLIVGILMMANAAFVQDVPSYIEGAIILALTLLVAMAGVPTGFLLASLVGGGSLVVLAGVETVRRSRRAAR
jgi:hypothetical protein